MKEIFQQYAAYNLWANAKTAEAMQTLSAAQQHEEINSSFNTIYKTTWHMWSVEKIWRRRLQQEKNITVPPDDFNGSMEALTQALGEEDQRWHDWIQRNDDAKFNEILNYLNLKGDAFSRPVFQVIQQVFNHATYHRGQLVTMMRQAGAVSLPATDFILWASMNK